MQKRNIFVLICVWATCMLIIYLDILTLWKFKTKFLLNVFQLSKNNSDDITPTASFEKHDDQFLVHTSACKIPNISPFDESILKYYKKEAPIQCTGIGGHLTYTVDNNLIFNEAQSKSLPNPLYCCIKELRRIHGSSDNKYETDKTCQSWNKTKKKVDKEFIRVECVDSNKTIVYKNYHAFVVQNKRSLSKIKDSKDKEYSVLLLGIDSMSRLNFHRHMEKTKKLFIEKLGAIELLGYNNVGSGSFDNLIPMSAGFSVEGLKNSCWQIKDSFDNCSFLWNEYSSKGYLTAMLEDNPNLSTFNYLKKGFYKQPTDYYLRPFLQAADEKIGNNKPLNYKMCYGPNPVTEVVLKYVSDYIKFFKSNKTFAFIWINSPTHDFLNFAGKADPFYSQFFTNLTESGVLNDTIIIFLSDHGMRWGGILKTETGKLEQRLPFAAIYLPLKFKEKYFQYVRTLKTNTKRLTTPFDIYHTLRHLLDIDHDYKAFNDKQYGQSLFEVVDRIRTCESAGIPDNWCTCYSTIKIDKNSEVVRKSALAVVEKINNEFKKHKIEKLCSKLSLKKIISANIKKKNEKISSNLKYYSIVFETTPGRANFETIVEVNGQEINPRNQISRKNLYKNQSDCINVLAAKIFCYCKP